MFWTLAVFFLSLLHCFCCEHCSKTHLTASTQANQTLKLSWYPNADCTWEITAKYLVVFSVVFVDTDSNCADFLEINAVNDPHIKYSWSTPEPPFVGKICGKKGPFTIAGKKVIVRFVSTRQKGRGGFRATYFDLGRQNSNLTRDLHASVSSYYHLRSGYIFGERKWTIRAPKGRYIELNILSMDWGWNVNQQYCHALRITNYVTWYSDSSNPWPATDNIRKSDLLKPFASTTNKIDVIATASRSYCFSKGFHIIFKARKVLAKCSKSGEVVDVNPGNVIRVSSTNFPEQYQSNQRCVWRLQAPPGYYITVRLNHIAVECCCDYVEFRDGKSDTDRSLQKVSGHDSSYGSHWGRIMSDCQSHRTDLRLENDDWRDRYAKSSGRYLTVIFYSDASHTDRGFLLEFRADKRAGTRHKSIRVKGDYGWVRIVTPVLSALVIVGIIAAMLVLRRWKRRKTKAKAKTEVRYQRLTNDATEESSSSFVTFRDHSLFVG